MAAGKAKGRENLVGDDGWQAEPLLAASRWNVGMQRKDTAVQVFQICLRDTEEQKKEEKPGQARSHAETVLPGPPSAAVQASNSVMGCPDLEMTGGNARVCRASGNRSNLAKSREADCPVWTQEALLQGDNVFYFPLN